MTPLNVSTRTVSVPNRQAEPAVWTTQMAVLALVFVSSIVWTPPPAQGQPAAWVPGDAKGQRRIQDSAVVPAGGGACPACVTGRCRQCPAERPGHHDSCREGRCVPYCPVRPQHYGFYGTQWRKWPGQGVVPVSDERQATPALPPRLAVPSPDEESTRATEEDVPETESAAEAGRRAVPDIIPPLPPGNPATPAAPAPTRPKPIPQPEPAPPALEPTTPDLMKTEDESTKPQPDPTKPVEPKPAPSGSPADDFESPFPEAAPRPIPATPKPATPPRPEDENLFEAGWRGRSLRKFSVGQSGQVEREAGAGEIRATMHATPVDPLNVPRVPFDPAAESRRLRSGR